MITKCEFSIFSIFYSSMCPYISFFGFVEPFTLGPNQLYNRSALLTWSQGVFTRGHLSIFAPVVFSLSVSGSQRPNFRYIQQCRLDQVLYIRLQAVSQIALSNVLTRSLRRESVQMRFCETIKSCLFSRRFRRKCTTLTVATFLSVQRDQSTFFHLFNIINLDYGRPKHTRNVRTSSKTKT